MTTNNLELTRNQYETTTQAAFDHKEIPLGPWTSFGLVNDPRHLCFVLSRYKFCAKMLQGKDLVIEVGCGDGFGLPIVSQAVKHVLCIDWDERNIENCRRRLQHLKNVTYLKLDLNQETLPSCNADALYSIDVIEHIDPKNEKRFMENMCGLLKTESVMVIGTPNITASAYASKNSELLHINLKSQKSLRDLMLRYFKYEFSFGMNDEVLHTGYAAMCHYLWSVGAEKIYHS